ncbi:exodeoxyribonuclease VII small subunit [Cellulomonas cellasea]|uniref:Exodeoxyribonuclease 7 small subunit n=1 Tax=Cellulomonas cellasea TaxID=43670 RepID=A0A7W4UHN9_9CELL|nr:exodeoxyribonuclease VII small subunit [Cellulomonas cellasea]MBB2923900.1 exodeoxyribonuclease VII small subunit [Cellulomonas cellasea]
MPKTTEPAPTPAVPLDDAHDLSYEQARDELVAVVARLEAGGATLEESLVLWERGEVLAARCQEWLDGARERLASARGEDPGPDAEPSDAPATAGGAR